MGWNRQEVKIFILLFRAHSSGHLITLGCTFPSWTTKAMIAEMLSHSKDKATNYEVLFPLQGLNSSIQWTCLKVKDRALEKEKNDRNAAFKGIWRQESRGMVEELAFSVSSSLCASVFIIPWRLLICCETGRGKKGFDEFSGLSLIGSTPVSASTFMNTC